MRHNAEPSPFLHRKADITTRVYHENPRYARAERDKFMARMTLEKLRYRWWERQGTLARHMQRLGDFGRKYFGFLAVFKGFGRS